MYTSKSIRRNRMLAVIGLALLLIVVLPAVALAQPGPEDRPAAETYVPNAVTGWGDDGGAWEIGVEAAGGNLATYAWSEASALFNRLKAAGWNGRYAYSGSLAWEEDFKRSALGGTENSYVDTVDLGFYIGHGSPWGFTFDTTRDDATLSSNDCYRSWGDGDNEWVAMTSCQVLSDPNRGGWANCMYGQHQILGFITNAYARTGAGTQGWNFGNYLANNWTVTGAWFKACDVTQPAGTKVRALANELGCYNDRPGSSFLGCSDSYDWDWWYWDHYCGSELPQPMDTAPLNGQMPVFRTVPLSLAEAEETYTELGGVFGVNAQPPLAAAPTSDPWRSETNGLELEMDPNSGQFGFYDTNNLWNAQDSLVALASGPTITMDDAKQIADQFLQEAGLMPGDASYYETVADTVAGDPGTGPEAQATSEGDPTVYQVLYSRYVQGTVLAQDGSAVTENFMVTGPGAKLKVYVDTTAPSAASAGAEPIQGVLGGWHQVEQPGLSRGPAYAQTVPILTEAQILKLFADLPEQVVINTPPIDADASEVISTTVAYWEEAMGASQSELVPVYALHVRWLKDGNELIKDFSYIPANQIYMRPFARIDEAPTAAVNVGQQVTLTAADATKTLTELGYDASLNFALGSGDYQYDWYLGGLDAAHRIGGGRTLNYVVSADASAHGEATEQTITLKVTDIGGADQRSNTASVDITVNPRLVTPLQLRSH